MYLQKGLSQDSTVVDRATRVRPTKPNLKKKMSTFYSSQIHTHSQGGPKSCLLVLVYSTAIEHVWHYATSVLLQSAVNTERPWAERERGREREREREGERPWAVTLEFSMFMICAAAPLI